MAQSNAERQRSYRQRAAEALRAVRALADAEPVTDSGDLTPMPPVIYERMRNDQQDEDEALLARGETARSIAAILEALNASREELDELPGGYVELLGGKEYIEAALAWLDEVRRARGRRRDQLERQAPTVPGVEGT